MARLLAISSQVARGHVGLSVIVPALQALGHEIIALPTVVLSNHPGHPHTGGLEVEPEALRRMLDALEANGWLAGIDGILTGYLPSARHVAFAAEAVARVRAGSRLPVAGAEGPIYVCDPVMGDLPKGLYIDAVAAGALRDTLLPLADVATPNSFELGWLAGSDPADPRDPERLLGTTRCPVTVATSMPDRDPGMIRNVMSREGGLSTTRVRERPDAPHGTGDLFAAILLAALVEARSTVDALAKATAAVDQVLAASTRRDMLLIAALPRSLDALPGWPVETLRSAQPSIRIDVQP